MQIELFDLEARHHIDRGLRASDRPAAGSSTTAPIAAAVDGVETAVLRQDLIRI